MHKLKIRRGNPLEQYWENLRLISIKLKSIALLIGGQRADAIAFDDEAYWGLAMLIKDCSVKVRKISQKMERDNMNAS